MASTDDAVNITSEPQNPHTLVTTPTKREDLTEGTGVVPAKYPPNVKSELFSQL